MASLVPYDERKDGWTQERIANEIRKRLAVIPGVNLVMAQPISDRVDEMVTGVRADVAVKLFGDDLDVLIEKANEIGKVAKTIRGFRDSKVDRVGGQQYLNINIDRQAIARYGLNAADVHDIIEMAIAGKTRHRDLRRRAALSGRRAAAAASCATACRIFAGSC